MWIKPSTSQDIITVHISVSDPRGEKKKNAWTRIHTYAHTRSINSSRCWNHDKDSVIQRRQTCKQLSDVNVFSSITERRKHPYHIEFWDVTTPPCLLHLLQGSQRYKYCGVVWIMLLVLLSTKCSPVCTQDSLPTDSWFQLWGSLELLAESPVREFDSQHRESFYHNLKLVRDV